MRTSTIEAPKPAREAIDLRRRTLDELAAARIGTLVYAVPQPGAAKLRTELEERLRVRGLALRDAGAFHLEIIEQRTIEAPRAAACRFCSGAVWCGRCRRCGTSV